MKIASYKEKLECLHRQICIQEEALKETEGIISYSPQIIKTITECKARTVAENFKILIMGKFSAGKSTMINALLGEPILPSSPIPTTAIITVVRYSNDKRAVVYPIPGKWKGIPDRYQGGDEPFAVPVNELRDFLKIDHRNKNGFGDGRTYKEGDIIYSPFSKMEIYWPLEILKDGVEIIDSPGLDDPTAHDKITKDYISHADAIIYCLNGTAAYSSTDVEEIKNIRLQGYKCPMYAVTYFDIIRSSGQENVDTLIDYIRSNMSPLSDLTTKKFRDLLGGDGIFYLASLEGLQAKNPYNHEKLVDSGYAEFEQYLGDFLVKCSGAEKVNNIIAAAQNTSIETAKAISHYLSTADSPLEEFEAKYRAADVKITNTKLQADLFVREFNLEVDQIPDKIKKVAKEFVTDTIAKLSVWRSDYKCSVKTEILHPKRSATAISDEFNAYLKSKITNYSTEWMNDKLLKALNSEIKDIGGRLDKRVKALDTAITDIKVSMEFQKDGTKAGIGGTGSRIASFAYGLFTGDWITAGVGMALGGGAMLRGIGYQFAAGVVLGIVALFTPIGLPAVIAASIGAAVAAGFRNVSLMEKHICDKVIEAYTDYYKNEENANKTVDGIMQQVTAKLESLKEEGKTAAYADIDQIRAEADSIIENKKKCREDIEKDKTKVQQALQKLENVGRELENIK